jgi:hypothetical protein
VKLLAEGGPFGEHGELLWRAGRSLGGPAGEGAGAEGIGGRAVTAGRAGPAGPTAVRQERIEGAYLLIAVATAAQSAGLVRTPLAAVSAADPADRPPLIVAVSSRGRSRRESGRGGCQEQLGHGEEGGGRRATKRAAAGCGTDCTAAPRCSRRRTARNTDTPWPPAPLPGGRRGREPGRRGPAGMPMRGHRLQHRWPARRKQGRPTRPAPPVDSLPLLEEQLKDLKDRGDKDRPRDGADHGSSAHAASAPLLRHPLEVPARSP